MLRLFRGNSTTPSSAPDYSSIDSKDKAETLAQRGELQKLLLLPEEFGGSDVPPNAVYVPPFVVELKESTDANVVLPLAQKGTVMRYQANPAYQGKSLVPISITIVASDPGSFTSTIKIWGNALKPDA